MRAPDFTSTHWRKSSRSNGGGACVEVAAVPDAVGIRDSKLGQNSPVISVESHPWRGFVAHLKQS